MERCCVFFRPKNGAIFFAFLTQNKAKLRSNLITTYHTLVFEKKDIFLPKIVENRRKL
jgi:hypothetical protein